MKRVRAIFSVFTSISFLDVVVERSLSSFPTSPILTCRLTVQTVSFLNVHGKKLQRKTLVHPLAGAGYLAEWLTQLQTQVVSPTSPTSSATWTRSTRRSTSLTATTISRAGSYKPPRNWDGFGHRICCNNDF